MTCNARNLCVFAVLAFLLAAAGNSFMFSHGHGPGIALLGGVLLAVLLRSDMHDWCHWTLVAFAADGLAVHWICQCGLMHPWGDALAHVAGAAAAAWLTRRVCNIPFRFDVPRNVLTLVLFCAVPAAAISASLELAIALAEGRQTSPMEWMICWTAYTLGALVAAPLALTALQHRALPTWPRGARGYEALALAICLVLSFHIVFSAHLPLVFLLLPPMLWAGLRFGMLATAMEIALLSTMALHATVSGHGPYAHSAASLAESLLMVQSFLVLASAGALMLVTVTSQRRSAQADLMRARDDLEAQVAARTAALRENEQRLRVSEARYRNLFVNNPLMYFTLDGAGVVVSVNPQGANQLGYAVTELTGRPVTAVFPPELHREVREQLAQCLSEADQVHTWEITKVRKDGTTLWVRESAVAVPGDDGEPLLLIMCEDITARRQAELDKLREREQRYRTLVEHAVDIIYETNEWGQFTYFNTSAALKMLGYVREDLVGRHYLEFVHRDHRAALQNFFRSAIKEGRGSGYIEFPVLPKNGPEIWVGQQVNLVWEKDRVITYQGVCRNINDRMAAQAAQRDANDRLRRLSARQEELLETERTRIAQNLHDGVGQSLNLVRLKIQSAMKGTVMSGDTLREAVQILEQSSSAIRSLEFELSPPVLRELGLKPALEWLSEDLRREYGLVVSLSDDGEAKPLGELARVVAFRAVRELLLNVIRHAGVTRAHVDQQRSGERLVVTVSDQGCGFEDEAVAAGLGLVSVRERIGYVGGDVAVHSKPGEGVVATLSIPLTTSASVLMARTR